MKALFFLCISLLCNTFLSAQNSFYFSDGGRKTAVPFQLVNNLPIVQVKVNGVELSFILDTGVKASLLFNVDDFPVYMLENSRLIKVRGLGREGYINALRSENNSVEVGKAISKNHQLYVLLDKFELFSARMGIPVHGILGSDLFDSFVVKINYSSKNIILYDKSYFKKPKSSKWLQVPLEMDADKPYLNVSISNDGVGHNMSMLIDSGSSDALWILEEDGFIKNNPTNYISDFLGIGLGGDIYGKRSRVDQVALGNYILKDVITSFPDKIDADIPQGNISRSGSVGGGILSRFDVIFDYKGAKAWFKPNHNFKAPFHYNMSGITVAKTGVVLELGNKFKLVPVYTVVEVRPDSPAALAGVEKLDEIVSINGLSNSNYSLTEIISLFTRKEGKKITLVLKRRDDVIKTKFMLKRIL